MPRANRYLLPDHACHVTHRCHDRSFLLRFARDRDGYRARLREACAATGVRILTYCITSNHVHLVTSTNDRATIAGLMQRFEGDHARAYNRRKQRSGAFWEGRYHATMIATGNHLWNCMVYVDVNMVRAGVVTHPGEWPWCGYQEITGARTRYCIVDMDLVRAHVPEDPAPPLTTYYDACIARGMEAAAAKRDPMWTDSIAIGSQNYVDDIATQERKRVQLHSEEHHPGTWCLREREEPYGRFSGSKKACKGIKTHAKTT